MAIESPDVDLFTSQRATGESPARTQVRHDSPANDSIERPLQLSWFDDPPDLDLEVPWPGEEISPLSVNIVKKRRLSKKTSVKLLESSVKCAADETTALPNSSGNEPGAAQLLAKAMQVFQTGRAADASGSSSVVPAVTKQACTI